MGLSFITIRFLDVLDILLVAFLMYQIYMIIRGTVAINIFIGITVFYILWILVKALNMQLLGNILGQIIGVGVIALIIVFQQEIRRFLLLVGTRSLSDRSKILQSIFFKRISQETVVDSNIIVEACFSLASKKTGALIVIAIKTELDIYVKTGEIINSNISVQLIESIFNKYSPLHDGAVIIKGNQIHAASCVLPMSDKDLPGHFGMRHRAAIGLTEITDAIVIVVSEERGTVSVAHSGKIEYNISREFLDDFIKQKVIPNQI
jgi:uncharacterized protein (TIGR00159 family)